MGGKFFTVVIVWLLFQYIGMALFCKKPQLLTSTQPFHLFSFSLQRIRLPGSNSLNTWQHSVGGRCDFTMRFAHTGWCCADTTCLALLAFPEVAQSENKGSSQPSTTWHWVDYICSTRRVVLIWKSIMWNALKLETFCIPTGCHK
jgi:hypothetical protein